MNKKEFNFRSKDGIFRLDDFLFRREWMLDKDRNRLNDIYFFRFKEDDEDEISIMFLELEYSYFPRINKPFPFKK